MKLGEKVYAQKETIINGEIFKEYAHTGYKVSNLGRVLNKKGNFILKPKQRENGYLSVNINNSAVYIHNMVARTFLVNNWDNSMKISVIHKNGDNSDNRVDNLEIATKKIKKKKLIIYKWTLDNKFISRITNIYNYDKTIRDNILNAAKGKTKTSMGFRWSKDIIIVCVGGTATTCSATSTYRVFYSWESCVNAGFDDFEKVENNLYSGYKFYLINGKK